jgi:genome maintenance exonuclease 1
MYYPGLYAGSADLIAKHDGEITVIDFKQTNKPKREEWIEDYFLQLSAYAMAHDYIYGTSIDKAMIMMCSVDNYYQEWIISGSQLKHYKHEFLRRVDQFYGR